MFYISKCDVAEKHGQDFSKTKNLLAEKKWMRIFRSISKLSKPEGRAKISANTLAYIQTRTRLDLFTLVSSEFEKSNLSQSDLAARLGKGTDRICKILGAPGNWTLDTVSELLFAINGGVLSCSVSYPLEDARVERRFEKKESGTDRRAIFIEQPNYAAAA